MFNTAGVCSIGRVFSSLSIVSLVVLLGACTNAPTPDPGEPKSWVVENVGSKPTAELYTNLIAPAVFERSSSKVINGYTVESGMLRMPDKSVGSLVTVRSVDGSLTALIDRPGKRGLLNVSNKGIATFKPDSYLGPEINDAVPSPVESLTAKRVEPTNDELRNFDVLIGFSKAAVEVVGGDAVSFALAQVELNNLYLRNSLVSNVLTRLVGVQIVEKNYGVSVGSLGQVPAIFAAGAKLTQSDTIAAFFAKEPGHTNDGFGYQSWRYTIQTPNGRPTFVHELGHNAGGSGKHCDIAGATHYAQGYDNGRSRTIMCGGWYVTTPHFSNLDIKDQYGLALGDPEKADMARVWRENAQRLSSYAPPSPYMGLSAIILGPYSDADYSLLCPAGTVTSGRGHTGSVNYGWANYLCVLPKVGSIAATPSDNIWTEWGMPDIYCPKDSVLSGVQQNGANFRARCTKLFASGAPVKVKPAGTHYDINEADHQFACPIGQYITSSRSAGESGGKRVYDCATLQ